MFSKFTEDARKVLVDSKKEMVSLKHPFIGTEHIFLAILKNINNPIYKKLSNYNINYKNFREALIEIVGYGKEENKYFLYTPLVKRIIEESILEARENNSGEVTLEHLFLSMLEEGEGVAIRILISMNINIDEIYNEFKDKMKIRSTKKQKKLLIDDLGYDMNKKICFTDPVIGREKEINRIIEILCRRTKNNPLLLGEAGVGKSAIVEELSRRIVENEVPVQLLNKRIMSVSMANLVSGTKYRGEFEERITKMLKEVEKDNNIILFIDEIHTLVGAGGAEGAIDASNILKPALARGQIRVIGATTNIEYKKFMEEDRALARRFQPIYIEEPNNIKTFDILKKLRPIYEKFHKVKISDEILELIIDLSNKYIYDRKQPDKAIDILDEASAKLSVLKDKKEEKLKNLKKELKQTIENKNSFIVKNNFKEASIFRQKEKQLEDKINKLELNSKKSISNKNLTKKLIGDVIEEKTKIPIYELNSDNKDNLIKLENNLKKEIIGQDEAINKLCLETKKIHLGYKKENTPISLLFVGPTGVGKTLLVKEYTKYLYNKENLIRLDMSEYKEEHSISKIIGSPPGYIGYGNKNTIIEQIKSKPHAVILLDEIEKAHESVINLFLQALDEGIITSSNGETINLNNTTIIMTSNIGFNKNNVGFNKNENNRVMQELKQILSKEFLNRINHIVIFNSLTKKNIEKILNKKINKLRVIYSTKSAIDIKISKKIINSIIEESEYSTFGARRIDKIIEEKIDNLVIDSIIAGKKEVKITT